MAGCGGSARCTMVRVSVSVSVRVRVSPNPTRNPNQVRDSVRFTTVVMEHSLLHLLHQRHSSVDSMNISLEQLGEKFGAEVLKGVS